MELDLRDYITITNIFVIQKTIPWLVCTGILWLASFAQTSNPLLFEAQKYLPILAGIMTIFTVAILFYWELYRNLIEFRIEKFRLFVARGLLFRTIVNTPVTPFWDFCFRQTFLDWLFGVYRFQFWGDFIVDTKVMEFPAISREDAYLLMRWFSHQTDRQLSLADTALKEEERILEEGIDQSDTFDS
jgi:hypothetical protein